MKVFSSETALARVLVGWLKAEGWTVYQEVHDGEATCDVVATRGPLIWAIETKLQFGCAVLEQAAGWLTCANLVSVATPPSRPSWVLTEFARGKGIGWLQVRSDLGGLGGQLISEHIDPAFQRARTHTRHLRQRLRPEQLSGVEAGSQGGYYTPFKNTCKLVAERVHAQPGIGLRDLLSGLTHHYRSSATARSSVAHWAGKGMIPGVELRRAGKLLRFYPCEDASVQARRNRIAT